MTLIRPGYVLTIAAVGLIAAIAPHIFFIEADNFVPLKLFVALGGFIVVFWLLHEADANGKRDRKVSRT
ncbi:MAG: hypothetical protein ACI9KS_000564 [Sulfitobacter sp.]|jgi:hypothetical protein